MRLIYLVLVSLFILSCQEDIESIPKGLIEETFDSQEVGDTYIIRVNLPQSYTENERIYPVLYQLDGETTTGSVIKSYKNLTATNHIQEFIIVTIDYKFDNKRVRDYTPTALSGFDESGGAVKFLNFLRLELSPYINSKYRTNQINTLRGHSLGGLFASYALFKNNDTDAIFSNFIIESPSWWWDDNFSIGQEFDYAQNFDDLATHAYFSVGEFEPASMKGVFELIRDRIQKRSYSSFRSKFEILDNQNHIDVRENEKGLIEIFAK